MKIGLTGAAGTGKTVTIQALDGLWKEMGVTPLKSAARATFEERGLKEEDQYAMTEKQKWELQKSIFDRKLELDQQDNTVCDRTLLDHLAYCLWRCHREISMSTVQALEQLVTMNLDRYDHLFFFPVDPAFFKGDEIQELSFGYRTAIGKIIEGYITDLDQKVWYVKPGSIEERAKWIESVIRKNLRPTWSLQVIPTE